ncbi:hypothetical protein QZH41_003795 [Actinostola sp. cb2023]|nr:hypothetical protein QZH41_003795 [Actinostola sp. cb2023]
MGAICHFCLVDIIPTSPGLSLKPRSAPFPATTGGTSAAEISQSSSNTSQIFANLLHAFSSPSSPVNQITSAEGPKPFLEAREGLLSILPSVLTALISVWSAWDPEAQEGTSPRLPTQSYLDLIGSPKSVRLQVLQLLTPIVMNHTIIFLASLADVWHQRGKRSRQSSSKSAGPIVTRATDEQSAIVDVVYALKALSFDNTIETVKLIVRQVTTSKDKSTAAQSGLEVHILQFFYHYMEKSAHNQLVNARPALISLMKEGLQLNQPPALFLLLVILRSYVQRIALQEDKKAKKELQDITHRLIEACNTVAGSSLENAAWFRRNVSVIPQIDTTASSTDQFTESEISDSEPALEPMPLARAISSSSSHYSTQALSVMSEVLAPLLDVVFGSEEKDRVTSLLTTVMYNVTPYLKHHSPSNIPNFRACCAVVASLSGYQYMRRAWKRDVMEHVMDNSFFQMDISCIGSWRTIMDNLMTQDSTSFKDLMTRVAAFSQSASINIFANREQEMEQRAHLLKKLAFVIFCSEADQYQYCLPEIQERLAECIRLPQSPVLHEQVFLALRVLLLRMSPQHLTSLWPVIISEIIYVMLQLESDLSSDEKSHDQRMLISETLLGTTNGYVSYSQEKWLGLYLAAFKLLDLTMSLPSDRLPQFQMYRWAFEGSEANYSAAMTTKRPVLTSEMQPLVFALMLAPGPFSQLGCGNSKQTADSAVAPSGADNEGSNMEAPKISFPAINSPQRAASTGSVRAKVALKPGRSLMDWIRLGASGKDLTGVGGVRRLVSLDELGKHNTVQDCWISVRGKVYNITPYLEYHPGGIPEIMKGAGKDGTALFDENLVFGNVH